MWLILMPVIAVFLLNGTTNGNIASGDLSLEENEFALARSSDPNDHTAQGDVEGVNEVTKPGRDDVRMNKAFDPELHLADQLFEGCLVLDKRDKEILSNPSDTRTEDKKTHISYKDKMWPDNDIPYDLTFLGRNAGNQEKFERAIELAIKSMQSKTCVTFRRKRQSDHNWIEFYNGQGCFSELGRKYWGKLPTWVSLGLGCWKADIALHMLLHALGFLHEQNRQDRDEYVRVNWNNIRSGLSSVFHRHTLHNTNMYHFQYDFNSIMHFQRMSYSKNNKMTLQARHNPNKILGGTDLSELDVDKLNRMFCKDRIITVDPEVKQGTSKWTQWSACSKSCGLGQRFRHESCDGEDCKDIKYEMKACRTKKCISAPYDANFEEGSGIWEVKATTPTPCEWAKVSSKGNLKDHTTGIGSLLVVDTNSKFCVKGQAASLTSEFMKRNVFKKCVNFFYLMSGQIGGEFRLHIVYESGHHMMLWERTTEQGDDWKQGAATLPITEQRYKLKFVYRTGISKVAKMLLDDIYIDDGECIEGIQRCTDLHLNCKEWAKKGECFKNPSYMLRKCCHTCALERCVDESIICDVLVNDSNGLCSPDVWARCCRKCEDCLDKHPRCADWASAGECSKNPTWMKSNCKNSCRVCAPSMQNGAR